MTTDKERAEGFAWDILGRSGYNHALSDVEDACGYLDHPELKESDKPNHHGWVDPYPKRCYCGAVGYTKEGRFYAINVDEERITLIKKCYPNNPNIRNKFGEPYTNKTVRR